MSRFQRTPVVDARINHRGHRDHRGLRGKDLGVGRGYRREIAAMSVFVRTDVVMRGG
jgi:hypothetical protein